MKSGRYIGALLAFLPALSLADVVMPDILAGRALGAWLDALNSGDRTRQEAFLESYPSWLSVESLEQWRAGTGGYELLAVYTNDPSNVFFHVKQKRWAVEELGRLQVTATSRLESLEVWRMPPGAQFAPMTLDEAARSEVVGSVANAFESTYVYPDIGRKTATSLRKHAARGEYSATIYGEIFAKKLTDALREISHDKHAEVQFSYFQPEAKSTRMAADNCGFEKTEHLPSNIGYLKLDFFADPEVCAATADAAMTFLGDSDALILDLRENHGGRGGMVELIATYLFAGRTHLNDIFSRVENTTKESWTLPYVPGKRFLDKPVFVLTSKDTFSAAEDLSYVLKNLKRATLVGESTGGGAHPIAVEPIGDHFLVIVPIARSISPITKTDWEGTGVEPDVKTPAAEALEKALKLAAAALSKEGNARTRNGELK
jgi:hypothetical protein